MAKLDLGRDSLTKIILKYGIPSIFTMWIYSLYTIVDGIFIGKYLGAKEIAAVNIVMPYVNISFALGIMIAVGGGTIIAIRLGEGDLKEANRIYSLSTQFFMVLGGLLGTLGVFFPRQIVKILGANDVIIDSAEKYLFIISFFTIFYLLSYGFEIFIRIEGNPAYSMLCNLAGAIINIVLDYIFIVHLHWGIGGAALATGMAQLGTALSLGGYLVFKAKKLKFRFTKFDFRAIGALCFNGSSEFLTEIATGIVIMAFNINIMRMIGEKGVSAFGIIGYISTLVTMTMIGFSQGLQPVISYNYGAEKYKRIKKVLKIGIGTVTILGVMFYLTINFFAHDIISMFVKNDENLFVITKEAVRIYSFTYILMGINIIISAYFTAIEDALISAVLSILRGIIFINTLLYIFPLIFDSRGIWMSAPANEVITLVFSFIIFSTIGIKRINESAAQTVK
ncbi:MATE family efflux transporter [Fusobacterium perfoetens]|uniref:MATE family efflux transporter n=1 Tax=Fusobacterium perfoetens TaxID=852 RepID=UPI001F1CE39F|nr:MATE family efflux transporter [Fusobacterium perfoetens]MCF2625210.1 MATE family efflux transporter [Fusobacterium perfoetens]